MARIPSDHTTRLTALAGEIVARVRTQWRAAVLARAGVRAALTAAVILAVLVALDQALSLPSAARAALRLLPFAAAIVIVSRATWRLLSRPPDDRFALLAEERRPELHGWLTTSLTPVDAGRVGAVFEQRAAAVLERARTASFIAPLPSTLMRAAAVTLVALLLAFGLMPGAGGTLWRRWGALEASPADGSLSATRANDLVRTRIDLDRFGITVEPPAYTGRAAHDLDSGEMSILAGSVVTVRGPATPVGVRVDAAVLNGPALGSGADEDEWTAAWRTTIGQRGLSLVAYREDEVVARRVVPMRIVADREPAVRLVLPDSDVVVASARGVLPLRATVVDDFGVGEFRLSWILSRGGGESFSFTDGEWSWRQTARQDAGVTGDYDLDLSSAGLEPGDVLHVRAVAHDRNDVTGPGIGVSATRLIRIAREGEMAEVTTLTGFPVDAEKEPVLSQRMIVLLTERLIARAATLERESLLRESTSIANEQARLRGRLTDVVYSRTSGAEDEPGEERGRDVAMPSRAAADTMDVREWTRRMEAVLEAASRATGTGTLEERAHEHDADPSLAVDRELLGAFNAMYAAERELRLGEPARALPHEYRALEILQRAREAERVFLRGRQTVPPVDVIAARGTGDISEARPAARSEAAATDVAGSAVADVTSVVTRLRVLDAGEAELALNELAARVLADPAHDARAGALLVRAADAARRNGTEEAVALVLQARALLTPVRAAASPVVVPLARTAIAAEYFRRLREVDR